MSNVLNVGVVLLAQVMVKLLFDISKKVSADEITIIRQVVLLTFGTVMDCVPSFGVLAASTVGNVCPPSVLNDIFTLAQLTGAAVVLATAQVIVCVELPA